MVIKTQQSRLEDYKSMKGPKGAGRDEKNIQYWQARATENSQIAPRAKDGPIQLPSTKVNQRDSGSRPYERKVDSDARRVAKADRNSIDAGTYYPSVRRGA